MNMRIWYWKDEVAADFMMGFRWLSERKMLPASGTLAKTHILLKEVPPEENLERVFMNFQGEVWSPYGEARSLIMSKGLSHTSMSVGDIIEKGGSAWIVDTIGFTQLW